MVVELSNICNLACVHCAVSEDHHPHHATLGHLSFAVVDALVDDMIKNRLYFDVLILFWLGEPLLHPQFERIYRHFVRAIDQHQIFGSIEVHTNAILLDAVKQRVFLNRLPVHQCIHCTIDAVEAETYRLVKGRDALRSVRQNTRALLEAKAALAVENPRIVLQYIVGSNNVAEAERFRTEWVEFANSLDLPFFVSAGQVPSGTSDGIFFRQLDCSSEEEQQRETEVFVEAMQRMGVFFPQHQPRVELHTGLQPCSGFWKSPTIDWQGNLTMCTRDNTLENRLGNVVQTPFSKLWWGDAQRHNRQRVAQADYSGLSLCETCFVPQSCNHSTISKTEIDSYQHSVPKTVQERG